VLAEFARIVALQNPALSASGLEQLLREREALGSTGIGDGVAFPHCKSPVLVAPVILFGRSNCGVDFNAVDGKPVHLFFVLLTPEGDIGAHLKLLARLSRILKGPVTRTRLMAASDAQEIAMIVSEMDSNR
jgi:mannitol/fructose-specific phosphotransferase system IIA component (Ntr-type)